MSAPARVSVRRLIAGGAGGVAAGLFVGEPAGALAPLADAFVRLLQMAVLPYLTVSLVGSIGALAPGDITRLGGRLALVLAALWALALAVAFLMPLTFPPAGGAAFFSTTLLDQPEPLDLLALYIPANPFFALANSVVPAVVFFSMLVGAALIGVPRKQPLLDLLTTAGEALARVMRLVVRLTPYGLFVIAASTAGTLRLEQAGQLQVYLAAYAALALLLGLWVLPGLVGALTPIPVRDVFAATRDAVTTAVVAGDLFIVLPVLIGACRDLLTRAGPRTARAAPLPDVIVPVSFNFPHAGKILTISFVLFAGWFAGTPVEPARYPQLALTAVITMFGSVAAAVPFLLDLFRVPADTFQLFVASSVINSRLGTLVAAMHTVTLALVGACAAAGALRWRPRALARYAVITVAATAAVLAGTGWAARAIAGPAGGGDPLALMRIAETVEASLLPAPAAAGGAPAGRRLEAIAARGTLRVCYLSDALPFAFRNGRGELAGLDVALVHRLAAELRVRLELAPVGRDAIEAAPGLAALLRNGACDLGIGGIAVTTTRAARLRLSSIYLEETLALVVRDEDRHRFESWDAIRRAGPITIAAPDVPYYVDRLRERLPRVRVRTVGGFGALFESGAAGADAIALPAERGSAWTLRYPRYTVVVPSPGRTAVPLAFALPPAEPALGTLVDTWLDLKRRDGTIDALYATWILGRPAHEAPPRWSVLRDVLGWVE